MWIKTASVFNRGRQLSRALQLNRSTIRLKPYSFQLRHIDTPLPPHGDPIANMSSLRHRFLGAAPSPSPSQHSREPSPSEPATLVSNVKLEKLKKANRRPSKRRQWWLFSLGGVFGITVAAFFANQHDVINLEGLVDFNLESLIDVIPAGVISDAKDITVRPRICS